MNSRFLTADWKYLIMANYEVNPKLLEPFLPANIELDTWQGKHYVTLVGFLFHNTKVLGIRVPFHSNFEEINLRFYVKRNENGSWKRGVVFIKEIVPKFAISYVANTFFNEKYITCKTKHCLEPLSEKLNLKYEWRFNNEWNLLSVEADKMPVEILKGSEAEFITEHYWGYGKAAGGKTTEYAVEHPRWKIHSVNAFQIKCNFESLYGKSFAHLSAAMPGSVLLAEGSAISVGDKRSI